MNITIEAIKRDKGKKSLVKDMRNDGFIPGVIYSGGNEAILIKFNRNDFVKKWRKTAGELVVFEINVEGKKFNTVIKEKQINPVSRDFIHIDFLEMKSGTKISVNLPFKFKGIPEGVKEGGVLETLMREIEVKCFPKDLKEDIEIDISHLKVGMGIHIGDIDFGDFEVLTAADVPVVSVHAPRVATVSVETSESEAEKVED